MLVALRHAVERSECTGCAQEIDLWSEVFWESSGMPLKIGDAAPDCDLPAVEGEQEFRVKLSDFRGKKHVVLAFHPLDWTPT